MTNPGLTLLIVGAGSTTRNEMEFDVPPPGAGLRTASVATAGLGTSLAGMSAVSLVVLTNVVGRS